MTHREFEEQWEDLTEEDEAPRLSLGHGILLAIVVSCVFWGALYWLLLVHRWS